MLHKVLTSEKVLVTAQELVAARHKMDPALHKAATQGDVQSLRELLAKDAMILSSMTPQENTALHLAARLGHREFAEEVLRKHKALLIMKNTDGDTPLHLAARAGKLDVAELLIGRALQWPQGLEDQSSPLMSRNNARNTPLHEAVTHGRYEVAVRLLEAQPSSGRAWNNKMEMPLHIAARDGLATVVQKILAWRWVEEAVEVHQSGSPSGSAIHQAVLGGHINFSPEILEILLDWRSDLIKFTDMDRNNAVHYAARKNNARMVSMLLTKDPSLAYDKNNDQQSPLHVAAQYGSADAIKELLRQCPDVAELVAHKGWTALHTAVFNRKLNALQSLLRYVRPEEIMNRADEDGNTPLHVAVIFFRIRSALLLLKDRRVDPCILNKQGETARSAMERRRDKSEPTQSLYFNAYELYMWKELRKQESKKSKDVQLPQAREPQPLMKSDQYFELSVQTCTVLAALTATVTFAAAFTAPGGYDQQSGMPIHGREVAFKVFVVSNTIAMCSSSIVVVCFIWGLQDPVNFQSSHQPRVHVLTIFAFMAMVMSLMTAVYLTLMPGSPGLANTMIAVGCSTPIVAFLTVYL